MGKSGNYHTGTYLPTIWDGIDRSGGNERRVGNGGLTGWTSDGMGYWIFRRSRWYTNPEKGG